MAGLFDDVPTAPGGRLVSYASPAAEPTMRITVRPEPKGPAAMPEIAPDDQGATEPGRFKIGDVQSAVRGTAPDMPANWDSSTQRQRAQGVSPILLSVARRASEISPFPFVVGDMGGTRNQSTQDALVAAGKSRTRNSSHLGGQAIDLVPIIDGRPTPNASPEQYAAMAGAMKAAAAEMGVTLDWGGDWKGAWDKPHFGMAADQSGQPNAAPGTTRPNPLGVAYNGPTDVSAQRRVAQAPAPTVTDAPPVPQPAAAPAAPATPAGAAIQAPASPAGLFDDVPAQKSQQPKVSTGRALALGAAQGVTANFGDEITGAAAAAYPDKKSQADLSWGLLSLPADVMSGLARLGYEYMTGGDNAAKRYAEGRDELRREIKAAEEQHPVASVAGNVAGAMAVPLGGALNAATLPGRMARGAAVGAGTGAAAGAGDGQDVPDRAARALTGGVVGGAVGAAAAPVIEGAARGVGVIASQPINMMRAAANPQGAAERAVGRAYREAIETDPLARQRLSDNELRASQAAGGPATVLDTLGGEGRNLARSAANLSGGARDRLNLTLDERFETQAQRFTNWLNDRFSYPNADAQRQALDHVERTVNRANYNRAYEAGDRPIWSPELERLVGSDVVQDAIRKSVSTGKDRAITQGYGGFNSPVTVTPDGRLLLRRGPSGQPTYPNLQFWDQVRREVSNDASKARRSGADEDAARLGDLAHQMNAALDNLVPEYQVARQGASRFFGAENALEAGQQFVTQSFNNAETRRALAGMSDAERRLFQDGFVSHYIDMLRHVPDRADVVRKIYNSPAAREKIEIALGPQRARELEAMIRVETIMQQGLRAVQGNSTTAMQVAGLGLAGAAGGGYLGFDPTASGVATALATAGKRGIDSRVAQRVAEMLTSNDPAILNRGIQMIAANQRMMGALRSADSAGARIGGAQSPGALPAVQAPAIGRAEDDKPAVPRPPSQ